MPKSKVYKSKNKIQRRLDIRVIPKLDKSIAKKPYPPGQHGVKRRQKLSNYALQLREKQRAKFIYGIREKQFVKIYNLASKSAQSTGERLLQLLELRLDNVVYRSGIAKTRNHARQLTSHGHISVNNKKVNIPSYIVKKNDIIKLSKVSDFKFNNVENVDWIKLDNKNKTAQILKIPMRNEIPLEIEEQLIIEYFSR